MHLPTLLLVSAVVLGLTAAVLAVLAASHRVTVGYRCWVGAVAVVAVAHGITGLAQVPVAPVLALAHALLIIAPVMVLCGARLANAQLPLHGNGRIDTVVAACAVLPVATLDLVAGGSPLALSAYTAAAIMVLAYVTVVLLRPPVQGQGSLFGVLFGAQAAAMAVQWLVTALAGVPMYALEVHALIHTVSTVVFAFMVVHANHQRTTQELRESRRRLQVLASIDPLTQLPNRRHFVALADRALEHGQAGSASVVMFDIDHFKQINDRLGHAAGDRALRVVSRCTQHELRQHDVAGRHGGDEFALLLPRTAVGDAVGVAQRIVTRLQRSTARAASPQLSLSFGMVQMSAAEPLSHALRRADQALYEAKRQGRGRAVIAEGDAAQPVFSVSQPLGLVITR